MLPSETMYPYTAKEARERGELELWRAPTVPVPGP